MRRRTRPLIGRLPTTGFDTRFTSGIHPARRPRVARVYLAAPAREAGCPGGGGIRIGCGCARAGSWAAAAVRGLHANANRVKRVRVGPARLLRVQVCGAGAELSGLGLFRPACERNGWVSGAGLLGAGSGSCANGTGGAFGAASSSSSCEFAMRSNGRVRRSGDDTVAPLEDDSGRTSVRAYVP